MAKRERRSQQKIDPDIWRREGQPWLVEKMRLRDWRQADLARAMDKAPGIISRWLRGEVAPSSDNAVALAAVLGVDADTVLELAGVRERRPDDELVIRDVAATLRQLPPQDQEKVEKFAEFLLVERRRKQRPMNREVDQ